MQAPHAQARHRPRLTWTLSVSRATRSCAASPCASPTAVTTSPASAAQTPSPAAWPAAAHTTSWSRVKSVLHQRLALPVHRHHHRHPHHQQTVRQDRRQPCLGQCTFNKRDATAELAHAMQQQQCAQGQTQKQFGDVLQTRCLCGTVPSPIASECLSSCCVLACGCVKPVATTESVAHDPPSSAFPQRHAASACAV
jgi:hypothetical protein